MSKPLKITAHGENIEPLRGNQFRLTVEITLAESARQKMAAPFRKRRVKKSPTSKTPTHN